MLQRKIERKLVDWKRQPNHKPLIIKGCRQCGKTYSVMHFAKVHYKQVVYFNFLENPDYNDIFSGSLAVDHLIMLMSALLGPEVRFIPHETVLIFDEIQVCPEARTAVNVLPPIEAGASCFNENSATDSKELRRLTLSPQA